MESWFCKTEGIIKYDTVKIFEHMHDAFYYLQDILREAEESPIPKIVRVERKTDIIKIHYVGGEVDNLMTYLTYLTWCKGRYYILDGQIYYGGYPVDSSKVNEQWIKDHLLYVKPIILKED